MMLLSSITVVFFSNVSRLLRKVRFINHGCSTGCVYYTVIAMKHHKRSRSVRQKTLQAKTHHSFTFNHERRDIGLWFKMEQGNDSRASTVRYAYRRVPFSVDMGLERDRTVVVNSMVSYGLCVTPVTSNTNNTSILSHVYPSRRTGGKCSNFSKMFR
jgi:hypothetical protein